jgi:antitoxin (DNA-binding transcriptional repressor) of toxin-antitoxin stability system
MRTVDLETLKNNLSVYVAAAGDGETVQVTDHGRVVAEIVAPRVEPVAAETGVMTDAERRMADLIRRGIVTPAQEPLTGPPPRLPFMTFKELMTELSADREDR